jgi:hypothetical protein
MAVEAEAARCFVRVSQGAPDSAVMCVRIQSAPNPPHVLQPLRILRDTAVYSTIAAFFYHQETD